MKESSETERHTMVIDLHGKQLLTVAEAAQRARLCRDTIRKLIRNGKLPAIRLNARLIRISSKDLDAFLTPRRDPQ